MENIDYSNISRRIGKVLKSIRLKKGLSQEVVSSFAGISRSNLANIERGRYTNITITKIAKVCESLQVSLSDVIKEVEESD